MNHAFVRSLEEVRGWRQIRLDPELEAVVAGGFIENNGCFLLARCSELMTNAAIEAMHDRTGYECFISHIHIEDFVTKDIGRHAIRFAAAILDKWNEQGLGGVLNSIISLDTDGATVRFHYRRPEESWLADNLDDYEEAVLETSSFDKAFLELLH